MVEKRECCDTFINELHAVDCNMTSSKEDKEGLIVSIRHSYDIINHPQHYGGDEVYEVIKVIHAHHLNFNRGNAVKYILRAGIKDPNTTVEDLKKAMFYINYEIELLEGKRDV